MRLLSQLLFTCNFKSGCKCAVCTLMNWQRLADVLFYSVNNLLPISIWQPNTPIKLCSFVFRHVQKTPVMILAQWDISLFCCYDLWVSIIQSTWTTTVQPPTTHKIINHTTVNPNTTAKTIEIIMINGVSVRTYWLQKLSKQGLMVTYNFLDANYSTSYFIFRVWAFSLV